MPKPGPESPCSIARTLSVVGERWTFLILRDAFIGVTRFADFRRSLGIAPDVLADRLAGLVEHGILCREDYQEPGHRVRQEYRLTPAGQELKVVMAGLQQWGDRYLPRPGGPTVLRRSLRHGSPLHVGFIDDCDQAIPDSEADFVPVG
ncbi:MAG: helix-turn-helix domain-containing protein [Actinomycetota bacterium]